MVPMALPKQPLGKNLNIRDFHSTEVQRQSDADLKAMITKGKGKMPAFDGKLTGEQIRSVSRLYPGDWEARVAVFRT
ncbi:MAG: cytochrome c [Terriglobales bacterium]